jgi:pimeloyl-ACP methyl ester carboxylesterase
MRSAFPIWRPSAVFGLCLALSVVGCTSTGSSTSNGVTGRGADPTRIVDDVARYRAQATRTGEIYLMRGLMDIFSHGIDEMAADMRRKGLFAVNTSYTEWQNIAEDILRRSKQKKVSYPIIIIGHSLGANDASKLASYLGDRGVKVSLVVAFDPTEPGYVGKNVGTVINYHLPHDNNKIYKRRGFRGSLTNVNVSRDPDMTHLNVEKNPELQAKVIARAMKLTRPK